jgi:hypothetical protein
VHGSGGSSSISLPQKQHIHTAQAPRLVYSGKIMRSRYASNTNVREFSKNHRELTIWRTRATRGFTNPEGPAISSARLDRAPRSSPILQAAEIENSFIAHVFKDFAAQGRAAA